MSSDNTYGTKAISESVECLETWGNNHDHDYLIHIEHPEYTALCPRSGYPDFGTIVIDYVPQDKIVELKSIKLYINSFRQRPISHEDATNEIANKIFNDVAPKSLRVIGDYTRRGGVKTIVTIFRGEEFKYIADYTSNKL